VVEAWLGEAEMNHASGLSSSCHKSDSFSWHPLVAWQPSSALATQETGPDGMQRSSSVLKTDHASELAVSGSLTSHSVSSTSLSSTSLRQKEVGPVPRCWTEQLLPGERVF